MEENKGGGSRVFADAGSNGLRTGKMNEIMGV